MQKSPNKRLRDALQACEELATFTAGRTLNHYHGDNGLRRVVERLLEIVGEAMN